MRAKKYFEPAQIERIAERVAGKAVFVFAENEWEWAKCNNEGYYLAVPNEREIIDSLISLIGSCKMKSGHYVASGRFRVDCDEGTGLEISLILGELH